MAQRQTRQRQAIRDVLQNAQGPLLPSQVLALSQGAVPNLGIATVYRALTEWLGEGWLCTVNIGGEIRFECADRGHHHHFLCRECRRVFDLAGCHLATSAMVPPGFQATEHEVLIAGRCSDCALLPGGTA